MFEKVTKFIRLLFQYVLPMMADGSFSAGPSLPIIVAFDILPVFLYPFLA